LVALAMALSNYCYISTTHLSMLILLVLCEYSTFRIELNSYFSIRFDSKSKKHYSHSTKYFSSDFKLCSAKHCT